MKKQKSRLIPYRVYKKLFSDCPAHDYINGNIIVEFPEDYLRSKMYTPEGWHKGCNFVSKNFGRTPWGACIGVEVAQFSDGGCNYYDAYVTVGNVFAGGTQKGKQFFRSFDAAVNWVTETAETMTGKENKV